MKSRYAGQCATTGASYPAGTEIVKGSQGWEIADPAAFGIDMTPAPIHISQGEGYGEGFRAGQTLRHKSFDGIITVVRAGSTYYAEDGWSLGVGDEEGRVFWADCREATAEEAAPALAAEAAARARREQAADYARLFATVDGEYVSREDIGGTRQGTRLKIDGGFTLYGGGTELLVEASGEWAWVLTNNGADGDDWSRNNWGTGGAGAIARRYALTPERLALLRGLPGGDALTRTKEERREEVLLRLRDRALENESEAVRALFEQTPLGGGKAVPSVWALLGGVLVGMPLDVGDRDDSEIYLRAKHIPADDIHSLGIDSSDNASAVYLAFAAAPALVSALRALWPDWVGTQQPGRFMVDGSCRYLADNAADALRAANTWRVPVNGPPRVEGRYAGPHITVKPGASLVSLDTRIAIWSDGHTSRLSGGLGLQLWSDARKRQDDERRDAEAAASGKQPNGIAHWERIDSHYAKGGFPPIPAAAQVPALPEAASRLVQTALGTTGWRESGRYKQLLDVVSAAPETLDTVSYSGPGWSEERTLTRLAVVHADGAEETLYQVKLEWGSMGEDGDAGEDVSLFETEAQARQQLKAGR